MRRAGTFEFHSHTHSHVRWDKVALNREEKCASLRRDLLDARAAFDIRFGRISDHLCWPQGFYDDDYRQIARETGFRHFYTCEMGPNVSGQEEAASDRFIGLKCVTGRRRGLRRDYGCIAAPCLAGHISHSSGESFSMNELQRPGTR